MAKSTIRGSLPPIYADLLSPIFDAPKVEETRATCENCQMCDHGGPRNEAVTAFFHPDTKCCTFHPTLPNYLVGALLADTRPEMDEGKRRVRAQIAKRINILPQRIAPSKKWSLVYGAAMESSFGQSELLKCPYLVEDGRCSIWYHREAVCFTFFCKYDLGAYGSEYWNEMKRYFNNVEKILCAWVAKELWPDVKDFRPPPGSTTKLTLEELEERPPTKESYAEAWGPWEGREEEFFVKCYERVKAMTREEFARLIDKTPAGRDALAKLGLVIENLRVAKQIPARAALAKHLRVLPVDDGVVLTMPYNSHDAIKIEKELYEVLEAFSHERTTAETRESLMKEHGIELEDELLSMFSMHEILVGPPKGGICDVSAPAPMLAARCAVPPKK